MSPASYLTAPPRVAGARVAPLPCRNLPVDPDFAALPGVRDRRVHPRAGAARAAPVSDCQIVLTRGGTVARRGDGDVPGARGQGRCAARGRRAADARGRTPAGL